MSRADGQAPEEAFFKAALSKWSQHRDTIPAPWHTAAIDLDVAFMEARLRFQRIAPDPAPALAARWGVARTTAWRRTRHMSMTVEPSRNDVQQAATTEPLPAHVLADDCNSSATECNHSATQPATMTPVTMFSGPVEREQEGDKNTSKPAKAGGGAEEVCADLLKAMHAIALEHDPKARLQRVTTHETRIARTLKGVAKEAKAAGKAPAELILDGWRWWWANPRAYLREQYPGAAAYPIVLQAEKVLKYASAWAEVEAARYVPTADEALDAVLEVGCADAEARYPAAARAIRQAFDFEMGGNLARMRNPKDPDRMRAAWSAGYAKYLTPKLALVAR